MGACAPSLCLLLTSLSVWCSLPRPIFLTHPSSTHPVASGSSHGPNLVIQHIPPWIEPRPPPSFCLFLHSLSHFPFLLLSNCQAAPGPTRHLRHRLLILLDHRKNMFVFEMFEPFLIVIIWLRSVCMCVCVCVFQREVIFFFCNESRWRESVSIHPAPPLLLSLWF